MSPAGVFLRSLFERVKYVDRLGKLGHVENAVLGLGMDPDLDNSGPDSRHRFPVGRPQPLLDPPQLKSGRLPRIIWEVAERVER
jgi:hypothetical protein